MGEVVRVREMEPSRDMSAVEEVERRCEVGPPGKLSIFTDLLGDPICRVRNSPAYLMLVAEVGIEIVGMIRGCIKTVTCGKKMARSGRKSDVIVVKPVYTKVAYILGLRVSPSHRRMGIGLKLVQEIEDWFRRTGAEYSYIATEKDNLASLDLFTRKCNYSKFRTNSILVNPVHSGHEIPVSRKIKILSLSKPDSESLYRTRFATTEFFPRDIDNVINNKLSLGTFLAVPARYEWAGPEKFLSEPPGSWAVLSAWNCKDSFTLEVRGASRVRRTLARASRALDHALPWLRVPSVPELFRPFGVLFLYGLGGRGPRAGEMVRGLCGHAHNLGRARGCGVVASEVASGDPLRLAVPHWGRLSCAEDLWCMKRLGEGYSDGSVGDWTNSKPGLSIFVDPREF